MSAERFLSCDWGTSALRIRWVDADSGRILAERSSDAGIRRTYAEWERAGAERVEFYRGVLAAQVTALQADHPPTVTPSASTAPLCVSLDGVQAHLTPDGWKELCVGAV